jgi:NADPH2:quinone reductase
MMEQMNAIRVRAFGGPEQMHCELIPVPALRASEVLVRLHAIGVNPVDTYIRSGTHAVRPALPYTPGFDGAGVIEAIGDEESGWRPGDRVYVAGSLSGTYAQFAVCASSQVHHLAENVTFAQGAALGIPYATAFRALFQVGRVQPGETLLVRGASGTVGIATVQLARAAGLTVIGTAGTEQGKIRVRQQGAAYVLDHESATFGDELRRLTEGRGVDVIVEMLANRNLGEDLQLISTHGRVVVVGSRGAVEVNPRDLMTREAVVLGVFLPGVSPSELASIHAGLRASMEAGIARPIVAQGMPLTEAGDAHDKVTRPGTEGKIVLVP